MNFQQIYIRLGAGLLCLIFLASLTLKSTHALMLEEHHHVVPVCESGHTSPAAHLHDARFNPDDCSVCAFLFAVSELIPVEMVVHCPKMVVLRSPFSPEKSLPVLKHLSLHLRGPPAKRIVG